jgi:hypothetical protein
MASGSVPQFAQMPYTVIRIWAGDLRDPSIIHFGTGFFYNLTNGDRNSLIVVSNRHVLANKAWIELHFAEADASGNRVFGAPIKVRVDRDHLPIFEHPDIGVDLAAIPVVPLLQAIQESGKKPYALALSDHDLPPGDVLKLFHASTNVLMVGFPNGLMDEANNLPVVRRGILASPYQADHQGKSNFVIDIAAYHGSSGSPVFAVFDHYFPEPNGDVILLSEPRTFFIGVLHSAPQQTAQGIVPVPVPTSYLVSSTQITLHLGYCLKAFRIPELMSLIRASLPAS